jgi:hypothetical protein
VKRIDDEYGLDCPQLFIVNVSLPESVEKALDARTSMGVIGDLDRYQQYQMGHAMVAAAENPSGGGAAEGMGMGMGFAMAGRMMNPTSGVPGAPATPPPLSPVWHVAVGGETRGPYSIQQVVAGITGGQISAESMVWTPGMQGWSRADQVAQLQGYFQAIAPPPLP